MDGQRLARLSGQVGVFIAFFVLWEVLVHLTGMKAVILPPPSLIFATIVQAVALSAVAYLADCDRHCGGLPGCSRQWIYHRCGHRLFALDQPVGLSVPHRRAGVAEDRVRAVIPIWFGFGLAPKLVIAALIAFFPIVVNTARGLRSVEPELIQYMRSLRGLVEGYLLQDQPAMGDAVHSFFVQDLHYARGGRSGGWRIRRVRHWARLPYQYANIELDTPLMFAGIFALSVLGVIFFL